MDVRQLEYFLAVVDHGGVTRAAAALYISQPSLSQALRGFERSIGVTLFRRDGRGMVLTPEGEALVGPARRVLADLDAARDAVGAVTALAGGRLDVITDATLAMDPLAPIAGRLHRRHPGIRVSVTGPDPGEGVADAIRRGAAELGLTDVPVRIASLRTHPLGTQEMRLVMPPPARPATGAQAPADGPLPLTALTTLPLLLPPEGFPLRSAVDAAFAAAGVTPRVAVESGVLEALANMVFEGAGAAFFPAALAAAWERAGAVVREVRPAPMREIGVVHRGALSPAAEAFLECADLRS